MMASGCGRVKNGGEKHYSAALGLADCGRAGCAFAAVPPIIRF